MRKLKPLKQFFMLIPKKALGYSAGCNPRD